MSIVDIVTVCDVAKKAGAAILEVYNDCDISVEYKTDKSPVTKADKISNNIIVDALSKIYPDIPIVSEESREIPYEIRKKYDRFWLIDPLDGTKEFISKNGEFTVNIALIEGVQPILGVVYAPVPDRLYFGKKGEGAYVCHSNQVQKLPICQNTDRYVIVASKSHNSPQTQDFIDAIKTEKQKEFIAMGSSLKLCLVAEGRADIYPRFAPTMEWDIAAAHAICLESGADVLSAESFETLCYNKPTLVNSFFICSMHSF